MRLRTAKFIKVADQIIAISKRFDVDAQIIGRVEASTTPTSLTIQSDKGEFSYAH